MENSVIIKISGPLVIANNMSKSKMYELVKVGKQELIGEIIKLQDGLASIQVYEETSGLQVGEVVKATGKTLSAELGPGLMENIYDGIQRPLRILEEKSGVFLARGVNADGLDHTKKWEFTATKKANDIVCGGDIIGTVPENNVIMHKIMVPSDIKNGRIKDIKSGNYTVLETICTITDMDTNKDIEVSMRHFWPIRTPRLSKEKLVPTEFFKTGWRTLDTFFPIARGGAACVPGPFGSGKTVIQQTIAKYCDADIIIYIGCGERGNEMTEVLVEFPHIEDPKTGDVIMKRTVLIANTSNMPVAAREASIYTGITIAEYYRDMGYNVALMADSTSRWAEAMREISGRLEEMPGEEGYPAYLGSRTAEFYERAGAIKCLGNEGRTGSLSVIGAVSPPGGDLSEPVSQNTLRVTKCYWGLDSKLSYQRHFPAINWLRSYSLYGTNLDDSYRHIGADYPELRVLAMDLLQRNEKLSEIVKLVGADSLSTDDKLTLLTSKILIEDFLRQDGFESNDVATPMEQQYQYLKTILHLYIEGKKLMDIPEFDFKKLESNDVINKISQARYVEKGDISGFEPLREEIEIIVNGFVQSNT